MGLRKKNSAATAERVLGTDGRFYSPMKHPEHHKRQVGELERRNKVAKLAEIEAEMEAMGVEIKDLKHTLREEMRLNKALKEENARLTGRLDALSVAAIKPVEAKIVDTEKEADKAEAVRMAKAALANEVDPSETGDVDPKILKEAREGGKGVSVGETAKFEENVTGSNAPAAKGKSVTSGKKK